VVWGQTAFRPAIHPEPPRVFSLKPWSRLRPALNLVKIEQFLSPQCEMTIDLTILTVLSNGRPRSISWDQQFRSPSPRSTTVVDSNSRLQNSQISNLGFLCREIFRSGRSADTYPLKSTTVISAGLRTSGFPNLKPCFPPYSNLPELTICRHLSSQSTTLPSLRVFDLSTQINGPVALLSINGRDLLRVFGLLRSQISNFTLFQMDFIRRL
jgi:hypothetical protein